MATGCRPEEVPHSNVPLFGTFEQFPPEFNGSSSTRPWPSGRCPPREWQVVGSMPYESFKMVPMVAPCTGTGENPMVLGRGATAASG